MLPSIANRAIEAAASTMAATASASGRRTPADVAAEDVVSLEQQLAELRDELAREHEQASPPQLSSSPPAPFVSKHKEAALAPVQRDLSAVLDSLGAWRARGRRLPAADQRLRSASSATERHFCAAPSTRRRTLLTSE